MQHTQPETEEEVYLPVPYAPGFADLIDRMIKWFDDNLGVRPIPRDKLSIECTAVDRFTLRFETPVSTPKKSYIDEMKRRAKLAGWRLHWPEDDEDVLEISMSIGTMYVEANQLIKDLKK